MITALQPLDSRFDMTLIRDRGHNTGTNDSDIDGISSLAEEIIAIVPRGDNLSHMPAGGDDLADNLDQGNIRNKNIKH